MRVPKLLPRGHALWALVVSTIALSAAFACSSPASDVHDSDAVRGKACISCHSGAYNAAANPVHLNVIPETCQDCHSTKAWSPSILTDHHWWPIENKHVGVACTACHNKGFKQGDTPTDCQGCHQKDYDSVTDPQHAGFFPVDCKMCHADTGFSPSTFKHDSWPLEGRHTYRITPCASCHKGDPPVYKGTPTDCYACHQDDADNRAPAKDPNHTTFPHTCRDCHLLSGWTQGPPLSGLHPEAKFPIQTGVHADPRMGCLDCHKLEKGSAAGGANVDCINCHLGSHVAPAIDSSHVSGFDGGAPVPGYPTGAATTNYCLQCHQKGQHL